MFKHQHYETSREDIVVEAIYCLILIISMMKKITDEWVSMHRKKVISKLGILNGVSLGNVDTNVLGGNETPFSFASFWLCFCQANSSTNMEWMNLGGLIYRVVEACS